MCVCVCVCLCVCLCVCVHRCHHTHAHITYTECIQDLHNHPHSCTLLCSYHMHPHCDTLLDIPVGLWNQYRNEESEKGSRIGKHRIEERKGKGFESNNDAIIADLSIEMEFARDWDLISAFLKSPEAYAGAYLFAEGTCPLCFHLKEKTDRG